VTDGALELSRTLLRDAQAELADRWNPFAAVDLSVAMLAAQQAGVDGLSPASCFLDGLDALRDAGNLRPWLYRGAAQLGWTATQLHRELGLRITNLHAIDELIVSWIDDYPADEDAELLFGIAGLGVYGLDHLSVAVARRIVSGALRVIGERLESGPDGCYVRLRSPRWDSQGAAGRRVGWRAVGVAHGNAGIAAFLAGVVGSGLGLDDEARLLLGGVARWLVSVARRDSAYVFDSYGEPGSRRGRSSWCHGDPGIALALGGVARALDDPKLAGRVRASSDLAARVVLARPASLAGIADCCLCHGAAFLCYFGGRMSHLGSPAPASFAEQWRGYIRRRRADGELRYQADGQLARDASFLGGDSGVVCALTRAARRQPAAWERLLLMA
jgi:hypothetical protein